MHTSAGWPATGLKHAGPFRGAAGTGPKPRSAACIYGPRDLQTAQHPAHTDKQPATEAESQSATAHAIAGTAPDDVAHTCTSDTQPMSPPQVICRCLDVIRLSAPLSPTAARALEAVSGPHSMYLVSKVVKLRLKAWRTERTQGLKSRVKMLSSSCRGNGAGKSVAVTGQTAGMAVCYEGMVEGDQSTLVLT